MYCTRIIITTCERYSNLTLSKKTQLQFNMGNSHTKKRSNLLQTQRTQDEKDAKKLNFVDPTSNRPRVSLITHSKYTKVYHSDSRDEKDQVYNLNNLPFLLTYNQIVCLINGYFRLYSSNPTNIGDIVHKLIGNFGYVLSLNSLKYRKHGPSMSIIETYRQNINLCVTYLESSNCKNLKSPKKQYWFQCGVIGFKYNANINAACDYPLLFHNVSNSEYFHELVSFENITTKNSINKPRHVNDNNSRYGGYYEPIFNNQNIKVYYLFYQSTDYGGPYCDYCTNMDSIQMISKHIKKKKDASNDFHYKLQFGDSIIISLNNNHNFKNKKSKSKSKESKQTLTFYKNEMKTENLIGRKFNNGKEFNNGIITLADGYIYFPAIVGKMCGCSTKPSTKPTSKGIMSYDFDVRYRISAV